MATEHEDASRWRRGIRWAAAIVPVVVVAALVAACSAKPPATVAAAAHDPHGLSGPITGGTLAARSMDALRGASSFHVEGTATIYGPWSGGVAEAFIFTLTTARQNFSGTISQSGVPINVIRTGDALYIQGEAHFLEEYGMDPAASAKAMWGLVGRNNYFYAMTTIGDPGHLLKFDDDYTIGSPTTINGVSATTLINSKTGAKLYVASVGTPYPLRYESDISAFTYSAFNAPVTIAPPPADQVVHLY